MAQPLPVALFASTEATKGTAVRKPGLTVMQRIQLGTVPLTLATLAIARIWLGENVPPARLALIEWSFGVFIAWRIGSVVFIRWRRDIGADGVGDWYANSLTAFWFVSALIVAAFWLAGPFVGPMQQVFAVLLVQLPVTAAAMGTVKRPGHGPRGWPGSLVPAVIPAGILAFFAYHGGPLALPVSLVVALFCGVQLLLRELLQAAVAQAWRAEAEAAAQRDARTQFIASASHDLGQPLHSARLFFDQAVRGTDPGRRAAAAIRAEAAFDSVERQLDQMNSFLCLEAGGVAARLRAVAVGPVLANVVARAAAASNGSGPAMAFVDSRLRVVADADLLERALNNLVENALRHARASRLLIGARRHRDRVRIWVIDNGVGIAATDKPTLFDDYTRGGDRDGEQRGGFGLGLASVRRIATLLGGETGIDPKWRPGAAFFIDLPREMSLLAE
jgi:signal transduction histidine kinase